MKKEVCACVCVCSHTNFNIYYNDLAMSTERNRSLLAIFISLFCGYAWVCVLSIKRSFIDSQFIFMVIIATWCIIIIATEEKKIVNFFPFANYHQNWIKENTHTTHNIVLIQYIDTGFSFSVLICVRRWKIIMFIKQRDITIYRCECECDSTYLAKWKWFKIRTIAKWDDCNRRVWLQFDGAVF